jgi:hypothetical protein
MCSERYARYAGAERPRYIGAEPARCYSYRKALTGTAWAVSTAWVTTMARGRPVLPRPGRAAAPAPHDRHSPIAGAASATRPAAWGPCGPRHRPEELLQQQQHDVAAGCAHTPPPPDHRIGRRLDHHLVKWIERKLSHHADHNAAANSCPRRHG